MRTYLAIMVLILLARLSFAQTTPAHENQPSQPQEESGTEQQPAQKEDRIEIMKEKIPFPMLQELNKNPKYEGWEEGNVFYEKNTDQFIVHVKRDNTTQTFRFDKEGRPLQNNEKLDVPEKKN